MKRDNRSGKDLLVSSNNDNDTQQIDPTLVVIKPKKNIEAPYNLDKLRSKSSQINLVKQKLNKKSKSFFLNLTNLNFYKKLIQQRLPIFKWLPQYNFKSSLITDLMCGLTIGIMNIPQGMAYALLATLNPINGLYVSFFPVIIYALLGTSKHLVITAVAITSLLTGETINRMVKEFEMRPINGSIINNSTDIDENFRLGVAGALTILVGLFQIIFGLFGLGALTSFFSDTFISGYTCGSAFHVIISQVKDLFGMKNVTKYEGYFKIPRSIYDLITRIPTSNVVTVVCSVSCIIFLTIFKEILNPIIKKRLKFEFPSELLLLIAMTTVSFGLGLNQNYNVSILKNIPTGFPAPSFNADLSLMHLLIKDAFMISTVAISVSISLAALFSRRNNYKFDAHQEFYALGLTNVIGSVFSCFPTAASLSRSSLLESMGGHSQLASLFSSVIILIVIMWLAPLFKTLPTLCLASIIVVTLKNFMFQVKDFFKLCKINKYEAFTWMVTFLSVVVLDVNVGLFIGIGTSILVVIIKDMFSPIKVLVKYKNTSNYVENELVKLDYREEISETSFKQSNTSINNVRIYKIEHSIYFANCHAFQDHLYKTYGFSPLKKILKEVSDSSCVNSSKSSNMLILDNRDPDIILDFSSVNYVDTNGMQVIQQIIDDYKKVDIYVCICEAQESFLKMLYNMELLDKYNSHLFVTIDEAIKFSISYLFDISIRIPFNNPNKNALSLKPIIVESKKRGRLGKPTSYLNPKNVNKERPRLTEKMTVQEVRETEIQC
ncbi:unnamed protein product [Brachionus calyciflorus]|uniref:STAS domain-containing protein n=1 Tax=Brachionus calyciflorus TaxID=104777 RepID=A0A813NHC3_9BILA|nr:unnamed protein product [Brachionus calyciflorus]